MRDHSIMTTVTRHVITQHVVSVTHDLDLDDLIESMCAKCFLLVIDLLCHPPPEINK